MIRAGQQFFRDGGFLYTLNPGLLPKEGALDYFLFKSRHGFCEHYAAAFSTLMRAAGLPARIVVGYQGGEYNGWGGHYTIRQSDAHAWSEVWVTGKGWQREDPTAVVAPDRVSFGAESYEAVAADGSLSAEARLERLNALHTPGSWRWFVHYSLAGLGRAGSAMERGGSRLRSGQTANRVACFRRGESELAQQHRGLVLATVATILMGGTGAMRAFNRGSPAPDDPARRVYVRFCRRLAAAANVSRAESEGPLDYARRASEARPDQAAAIQSHHRSLRQDALRTGGDGFDLDRVSRGGQDDSGRPGSARERACLTETQEFFGRGGKPASRFPFHDYPSSHRRDRRRRPDRLFPAVPHRFRFDVRPRRSRSCCT